MITASHNPIQDNGLKMIDAKGEMLTTSWEKHATNLANAEVENVVKVLDDIISSEKIDMEATGNVFIAKDTRPSSEVRSAVGQLIRQDSLSELFTKKF